RRERLPGATNIAPLGHPDKPGDDDGEIRVSHVYCREGPHAQRPCPKKKRAPRMTTIATNWAITRARISVWLRLPLPSPPRNMFQSPMKRMTATTASATMVTMVTTVEFMSCLLLRQAPRRGRDRRSARRQAGHR